MKRLLFVACAILGLSVCAQDFEKTFYKLIETNQMDRAASLLTEWENKDGGNAEIFPARFNLYLNMARNSYIVLDNDTMPVGDAMLLADSIGQLAGSIHEETVWNDSLAAEAFKAIDMGIAKFPDRLDFRFGKATAYSFFEEWEKMEATAVAILEHSRTNDCRWQWSENEILDNGTEIMLEGIHDFERNLLEHGDASELIDLNLKYYPADHIALTMKGSLAYSAGDKEKALEYMEQAHAAAPDDVLIVCNMAYLNMEAGNKEKAIALCTSVIENADADRESKDFAKEMIEQMNTELKEMRLYNFEFKFLPAFAAGVKLLDDANEVMCDTEYITGPRLARIGYYLPVEAKDIKAEIFGEDDDAIIVWTMPMPTEVPLARYIAFVRDKENNCFTEYTLEKTFNWDGEQQNIWVLGQAVKDGSHINFGGVAYPETARQFAEVLRKRQMQK